MPDFIILPLITVFGCQSSLTFRGQAEIETRSSMVWKEVINISNHQLNASEESVLNKILNIATIISVTYLNMIAPVEELVKKDP